ncbi:MAG: hypothetical protein ACK4FR_06015 [Tabrizicola sp.]
MADKFTIRKGDRIPWIAYKFGIDLSLATAVTFSLRDEAENTVFIDNVPAIIANGSYRIDGQMVTLAPADGVVFYAWAATDTAVERRSCIGLFHIQWPGGLQETWPSQGFIPVVIGSNF